MNRAAVEPLLHSLIATPAMSPRYAMKAILCPFCGMATDLPHESQESCIAALHAEIARTRRILENVTEPLPAPAIAQDDEPQVT